MIFINLKNCNTIRRLNIRLLKKGAKFGHIFQNKSKAIPTDRTPKRLPEMLTNKAKHLKKKSLETKSTLHDKCAQGLCHSWNSKNEAGVNVSDYQKIARSCRCMKMTSNIQDDVLSTF